MEECQGRQRWQLVRACYMKRADCFGAGPLASLWKQQDEKSLKLFVFSEGYWGMGCRCGVSQGLKLARAL